MKAPYDRLAKIYTNCTGHMAKMATMPIYGENPLNIFFSGTKRARALARERSGSVVECLTRDRRAAGSSLTGVTALWSLSKTHLS